MGKNLPFVKETQFYMEMLFIVILFAAITKTRFSGLKWSSATILFHTYRKFDVNLPKTHSFCKKKASFIENNLPFVGIMFLSRKEAKGSYFRCSAIPPQRQMLHVCIFHKMFYCLSVSFNFLLNSSIIMYLLFIFMFYVMYKSRV